LPDARVRAAQLFERSGPAVYRRCRRLLGDGELARDATQEVFVQLIRNMERLEDRETVLPWVYRVATNHCLNLRRSGRRQGHSELIDLDLAPEIPAEVYPDRQLAAAVLSRFDPHHPGHRNRFVGGRHGPGVPDLRSAGWHPQKR
jgi:RNA polymerase sigma-70 factor (ECF subfamily)